MMKTYFTIMILFFYQLGMAQKIEEIYFNQFDNFYTVKTQKADLVGNNFSDKSLNVSATYYWFKKSYPANQHKKYYNVTIYFTVEKPTTTDSKTEIKFGFTDGTYKTYYRFDPTYGRVNVSGSLTFTVPLGDKLFTTGIKSLSISTVDSNINFEVPANKASMLGNCLALIKRESEKL